MPPPLLFSLDGLDLDRVVHTREEIYEALPHRHEFMHLDGICHLNIERQEAVAFRDVSLDEWWVKAHFPGRPIFPGVLMIETGAQMAAFITELITGQRRFTVLGGVDGAKFREAVVPPGRLYFLGRSVELKPRRVKCDVQAVYNSKLVFSATITGLIMESHESAKTQSL